MDQVTDLIARYLQAVKFWLPKKQQNDIVAELSEDLSAQVEERESTLGRKLTDPEVETILRHRGSPIMVANSYLPQQQLIGPLLFPIYTFVLKIVSLCILIPAFVGWIAALISHALRNVSGTWNPPFAVIAGHLWSSWFTSMAVVTLIFAVIERTSAKTQILETWNPRKLPPLRPARAIPRSGSVIEIAVHLCILVWWATNMVAPLNLRFGNVHIGFTPEWSFFYWAILVSTLFNAALSSVNLMRPWWTTPRVAARLFLDVAGSGFFCWMLRARLVATITWPSATPDKAAWVLAQANLWLERAFPYAILICILVTATNAWRLIRAVSNPDAQPMLTALV